MQIHMWNCTSQDFLWFQFGSEKKDNLNCQTLPGFWTLSLIQLTLKQNQSIKGEKLSQRQIGFQFSWLSWKAMLSRIGSSDLIWKTFVAARPKFVNRWLQNSLTCYNEKGYQHLAWPHFIKIYVIFILSSQILLYQLFWNSLDICHPKRLNKSNPCSWRLPMEVHGMCLRFQHISHMIAKICGPFRNICLSVFLQVDSCKSLSIFGLSRYAIFWYVGIFPWYYICFRKENQKHPGSHARDTTWQRNQVPHHCAICQLSWTLGERLKWPTWCWWDPCELHDLQTTWLMICQL